MTETKTIKIDRDVYNELKKRIQEFDDTPNSVLRRVFNIDSPKKLNVESGARTHGKNIAGRIEGDRQRIRLKKIYGSRIDGYPILYHAGWKGKRAEVQKYSFGIPFRKFEDQKKQGGAGCVYLRKGRRIVFYPLPMDLGSDRSSTGDPKTVEVQYPGFRGGLCLDEKEGWHLYQPVQESTAVKDHAESTRRG